MERFYSNRALFAKASFCFVLPFIYEVVKSGIPSDSLIGLFYSNVLIGCLYTIPFWISVLQLHRFGADKLLRYILFDLAFCYAPAVISAIVLETISGLINPSFLTGVFTLLLSIILLLISGVFWILYKCIGKHNRP